MNAQFFKPQFIILYFFVFIFISCQKSYVNPPLDVASYPKKIESMTKFAKILSSLVANKEVRDFLKLQSQKKFGRDYDVFYPMVKNQTIINNKTFRNLLEEEINRENLNTSLPEIETSIPLLTILVPELESFSADKWNTSNTIPNIGVRDLEFMKREKKMSCFDQKGSRFEIDYQNDPKIPLLIIKDNEAVEIRNDNGKYGSLNHNWTNNHPPIFTDGNIQYFYSDESMYNDLNQTLAVGEKHQVKDNTDSESSQARPLGTNGCSRAMHFSYFDILAQEAYNKSIYKPTCPDNVATVRDYVYYGIDPTIPVNSGTLKYNYREYITSIRCENILTRSRFDDLGEGSILDFDITVYTADKDPIFPLKKRISIDKTSFFRTDPANPTPMPIDFTVYPRAPIEIAVWNFKRQGDVWKYAIFEYDPSTIVTESRTITANLGTNFSIGDEKLGGKFGLSASITQSNTITFSYTNTSDDLGEAVSYWCDPVIKEKFTIPKGTTYVCGWSAGRPFRVNTPTGRSWDIGTGAIAITVEPRIKL